jgi:hypothetical protein
VVTALIDLAADAEATPEVHGTAESRLSQIQETLDGGGEGRYLSDSIERFLNRVAMAETQPSVASEMPPGQPIGGASDVVGWSACSW